MSDILTKSVIPFTPNPIPGTPPQPAYCLDIPTQIATWIPVYGNPAAPTQVTGFTFGGYTTYYLHTCYPAVPGVPGVPIIPPFGGGYNPGWNSSADSIGTVAPPGEYTFSIPATAIGVVTGLSAIQAGVSYSNITWGMYFSNGGFRPMENGVALGAATAYATTDVFTITVSGAQVRYYQNTTLIYTSGIATLGDQLYASACLYMGGDQVVNAAISALDPALAANSGSVTTGQLYTPLLCFSTDGGADTGGYVPVGQLRSLLGSSYSWNYGNVTVGQLTPLLGQAIDSTLKVSEPIGTLSPMTGYSEAGLIEPNFAIVPIGQINNVAGFALDNRQLGQVTVGQLSSVIGNALGGGAGLGGYVGTGQLGSLTGFVADSTSANWFYGSLSTYTLVATGENSPYGPTTGFDGELTQAYSLVGQFGALSRITYVTPYTLSASGTLATLGEFTGTAPLFTLLATGTGVIIGRATMTHGGRYVVSGQFGASASIVYVTPYQMSSHGFGGSYGAFNGRLHRGTLLASGTQNAYGNVPVGQLTSLSLGAQGEIKITGPHFTCVAHGFGPVAASYEAYSHTLLGDKDAIDHVAVTRYTNYPFSRILRFGSAYYGVGTDGMWLLDGNLFDSSPILSVVQTGETDMGEPSLKRARRLYMSGRLSEDLRISLIARESETDVYDYNITLGNARNTRVNLGRGVEARYLAFKFQNLDGQDFNIVEMAPEVDVMRRTA